jgi:hypothetical protein
MLGLEGDPGSKEFLTHLRDRDWTDLKGFQAWHRIDQSKPLVAMTGTELESILESYKVYLKDIESRILGEFSIWQSGENV